MSSACAVCTAPLSALGGDLAACPGGDVFHASCLHKWVVNRGQCFTCKQRVTQQQLVTLKLPHSDATAITQPRKPAPSTPLASSQPSLSAPASPTLPADGVPLTLAQVEELTASYRRTATSYQQHRKLLQSKLDTKLQQLQLAYSRVVSQPTTTTPTQHTDHDADDALMHRHTLMAKLLACVHEARLRAEEDSVDEMARVVRRVTGEGADEEEGVAEVVRDMEQLMEEVDAQCWERIRAKRKQLADMEEEMRREQHEKQQWTQRIAALDKRRQQLEDSMHHNTNTRKRKQPFSLSTPVSARVSPAAAFQSPPHISHPGSPSSDMSGDSDDEDSSNQHNSPPLSATSSTASSAIKRRKPLPLTPLLTLPPKLTADEFASLSPADKMHLPRLTILQHCPTIESFLTHQLHLRTLKRRYPDNEWRKINTTYTGQRKRRGLKGRGRGRQVLPATLEEQQVWREVRKRELELLLSSMGGGDVIVDDDYGLDKGVRVYAGVAGVAGDTSGGIVEEDDDDDDEHSEDERLVGQAGDEHSEDERPVGHEGDERSEVAMKIEGPHEGQVGNGVSAAAEHPTVVQS